MIEREGIEALLDELKPGLSVWLPGASGEILALAQALARSPQHAEGLHFTGCLVPGLNETLDYASLTESTRVTSFMLPGVMRPGFAARRLSLLPLTYWHAARFLARQSFDLGLFHVAPPDASGQCSLGIASDFAPLVWPNARRRVLVINPAMPRLPRALSLPLAEAHAAITLEGPLVRAPQRPADATTEAIAARVAELVPDGASLQTGIGGAHDAIWPHLASHRQLVLRSGMVTPGFGLLAEAGALDESGDHVAGIAYGTDDFYAWLAQTDPMRFATTLETHGFAHLAPVPRLTSINSALEIDLFGQANVEWQGSRLGGGVGGGPDFMRAARACEGGRSILALPASARGGSVSRIVARLDRPAISTARADIDTVVTEHGVAALRELGLDARAQALIALAAPEFRGALQAEWDQLRAAM
jgi:acyl-CoA hydrolase